MEVDAAAGDPTYVYGADGARFATPHASGVS
jgi:hypothetical protein